MRIQKRNYAAYFIGATIPGLLLSGLAPAAAPPSAPAPAEKREVYRAADALRDIRDDRQGVATLAYATRTVDQYVRTATLTPTVNKAFEFASYVVKSADLESLFTAPFAYTMPDGFRSFALSGAGTPKGYVVSYRKASVDALTPEGFLGFAADFRIRQDPKPIPGEDRGFGLRTALKTNTGELSHRSLLRGVTGALLVVDPNNVGMLPGATGSTPAVLDAKTLADIHATVPKTAAWVEKYWTFVPGISVVGSGAGAYTQVSGRANLNLANLKRDFPELGEYVGTLSDKVELQAKVRTELPNGLRLAEATYDFHARHFMWSFKTQGGRIVPYDKDGRPHFEAAIKLDATQQLAATTFIDATARALGLTINVQNVALSSTFQDGPVATLNSKITSIPNPQVEGRALGVVPTWAVDALIPGNIQGYARKVADGMLQGSRGAGTFLQISTDTRDPKNTVVSGAAGTELVDNFFINFGMRVIQSYVWPNEKVLDSARKFASATTFALAKDMEALQNKGTGPG